MRIVVFGLAASGMLAAASTAFAQTAPGTATAGASVSVTVGTPPPPPQPPPPAAEEPPAPANQSTMDRTATLWGAMGYGYGFGTAVGFGARYQWVALKQGVLRKLSNGMHDEFAIESGLDYYHSGYSLPGGYDVSYNEFTPVVGVVWNFWLTDNLVVYPKIDIGYRIFAATESLNGQPLATFVNDYAPLYFQGAAGVAYKIGPVALRAEAGWEALRLGVALSL